MLEERIGEAARSCVDFFPEGDDRHNKERAVKVAINLVLSEIRKVAMGDENMKDTVLDYEHHARSQGPNLAMRSTIEEMLDRIGLEED